MKKVLTFGTFDILHPGHEHYLKEAKKHGDFLIVVIAKDETVKEVKGHYPKNDEVKRIKAVENLSYVDEVHLGYEGDKLKIVEEIQPDVICLGYDQRAFTKNLKEKLKERGLNVEVTRIKALNPEKYKSSKYKENIK